MYRKSAGELENFHLKNFFPAACYFASTTQPKNLSPAFCIPSCVSRTRSVLRTAIQKGELKAFPETMVLPSRCERFGQQPIVWWSNESLNWQREESSLHSLSSSTFERKRPLSGTTNTFIVASQQRTLYSSQVSHRTEGGIQARIENNVPTFFSSGLLQLPADNSIWIKEVWSTS